MLRASAQRVMAHAGDAAVREALMRLVAELCEQELLVHDLFVRMDANGNGTLSRDEMQHALSSLGICLTPPQLLRVMDALDRDGNGMIS